MAIVLDDQAPGIKKGRNGFWRDGSDNPYVADPSGATVKTGKRKGLPKLLRYGSPSNRGKQIENTTNLTKWGERRVCLGIGVDPNIAALCELLVSLDPDSDEYKHTADSIIIKAKAAAQASLAADRGTHSHSLTEDADSDRDWVQRAAAGELVGIPANVQNQLVDAWQTMLTRHGLEILAVETTVVDDQWRLAGTLDRIARCTRTLEFVLPGGELVTIPAGTVLVLDLKTGRRRTNPRGEILYWHGYSIQIASYAQSVPYDVDNDQRGTWPWPIDQEHALIAHLDVDAALNGNPECTLVYVDLVAGRDHGGATVTAAKAWEARGDIFTATIREVETPHTTAADDSLTTPATIAVGAAGDISAAGAPTRKEANGLSTVPTPAADHLTIGEQRLLLAAIPQADEGDLVDTPTWDAMKNAYRALNADDRRWITGITDQATRAGRSFHGAEKQRRRRWELIRALVLLCEQESGRDDQLRGFLEMVDPTFARCPDIPAGALVGALDARQAIRFGQLVDGSAIHIFGLEADEQPAAIPAA